VEYWSRGRSLVFFSWNRSKDFSRKQKQDPEQESNLSEEWSRRQIIQTLITSVRKCSNCCKNGIYVKNSIKITITTKHNIAQCIYTFELQGVLNILLTFQTVILPIVTLKISIFYKMFKNSTNFCFEFWCLYDYSYWNTNEIVETPCKRQTTYSITYMSWFWTMVNIKRKVMPGVRKVCVKGRV